MDPTFYQPLLEGLSILQVGDAAKLNLIQERLASDRKLIKLINDLAGNLKEEIFVELAIIYFFIRIIIFCCIWFESNRQNLLIKDGLLYIQVDGTILEIPINQFEFLNIKALLEANLAPVVGTLWSKLFTASKGKAIILMFSMISKQMSPEILNQEIMKKYRLFGEEDNKYLNRLTEGLLHMK